VNWRDGTTQTPHEHLAPDHDQYPTLWLQEGQEIFPEMPSSEAEERTLSTHRTDSSTSSALPSGPSAISCRKMEEQEEEEGMGCSM
jgi:hypothetical protein